MEKLLRMGKEFGWKGEKLLEFIGKQPKLEEERRRKGGRFGCLPTKI